MIGGGLAVSASLFACYGDPQVPSVAIPVASVAAALPVATAVGTVPSVRINDARGKGIRNVLVHWKVTSGSGRVTNDSIRTNASGEASSGGWTLGTTAGQQTLMAWTQGVPAVTFSVTAAPGPVQQLSHASPSVQSAEVNSFVPSLPSVRAEDMYGNPISGVPVVFSVMYGGGSITDARQLTNTFGVATVNSWQLGTIAGQQVLSVTSPGVTETYFAAVARAGAPASIGKIAGDGQKAIADAPVTVRPGVRISDAFGNPVGNVPVTFTPGLASGTVTGATTATDPATGAAFVGTWTLGSAATQTLVATSSAMPGASVTFAAHAVETLFDIEVRFVGDGGSTMVRSAFDNAATRWRSIVVGDVHNTRMEVPSGSCTPWMPAMDEIVNDVVIFARITPIDGPGKILGQAGPCFVNSNSSLSVVGIMEFDEDDISALIANSSLTDVVVHEMGHVLGIGTLWNYNRQLLVGAGGSDPYFQGVFGRSQFAFINTLTYGGNPVPVENTGGPGTRDSHWRESVLDRELMTGFLNRSVVNPLSRLTAGSLRDMGYVVNTDAADSYFISAQLRYAFPLAAGDVLSLDNDIAGIPLYTVTPAGSRTLIRGAAPDSR